MTLFAENTAAHSSLNGARHIVNELSVIKHISISKIEMNERQSKLDETRVFIFIENLSQRKLYYNCILFNI